MEANKSEHKKVDVDFESHPPIEEDLDGVTSLLKQTFLNFVDCSLLARHLIELKDVTQVIALYDGIEGENTTEEEEPDNDIYGVVSIINLETAGFKDNRQNNIVKNLTKFLKDKYPEIKKLVEADDETIKLGLVVNERYINLPPQISVPTLKDLTTFIDKSSYTHLVFFIKILLKTRNIETKLPSKKVKEGLSSSKIAEPIIFINPEEEIIYEGAEQHADLDVSSLCDENATWSMSSDIKYIPHRRILIVDYNKWHEILENMEKELNT